MPHLPKRSKRENPEFPFCSERCRTIDLGNWASEKYVISTPADAYSELEDDDET